MQFKRLTKTTFLMISFLIFLIVPFASAQGCFLYQGSSSYCQDLSLEEAGLECSFFEDCNLQKYFLDEKSCTDLEKFPQCKKILCKSSCQEEFLGKCVTGEIPEGKEQEWCTSGCCQFEFSEEGYCEFKQSKWLCELEARNKDVPMFIFAEPLDEITCLQECSQGKISLEKLKEEKKLENVSAEPLSGLQEPGTGLHSSGIELPEQLGENAGVVTGEGEEVAEKGVEEQGSSFTYRSLLAIALVLLLLLYGLRMLNKSLKKIPDLGEVQKQEKAIEQKVERKMNKMFNFFRKNPHKQKNLKSLRTKREHKVSEKKREELFKEFGSAPVKTVHDPFKKLERMTKHHHSQKEETTFENLEKAFEMMKREEVKVIRKKEFQEALEKLRKMAEKKK
ncbi:MAG: hypothetical protein KKA62_01335 [Nanoarchaeota archaeon]|nr:hypothetical protein [Nanoarchaeota archaeon]MBU1644681.1 hypothetical protein [Nanoarchaeota archaeon]MBU1976576.1 hypothetical protein [Nanoarchaeota archaeon]